MAIVQTAGSFAAKGKEMLSAKSNKNIPRKDKAKKVKKKKMQTGPVQNEDGIPYNYIVVMDAGSKGTRAYVYNWLSTQFLLANGKVPQDFNDVPELQLLRRVDFDQEEDAEDDYFNERDDSSANSEIPRVNTQYKWSKKIKPGLSEYQDYPKDVGSKYLSHLIDAVKKIVPIEQHYRTPIFLHATAGMRLLPPQSQRDIMSNACAYLKTETDFYIPDCDSHISIIDGDVEGLFGWIALNYLTGSLNEKNSKDPASSYGLLEMGGASTQIAFQPASDDKISNSNALFKLELSSLISKTSNLQYDVFCASFLGYGLTQAHENYYTSLDKLINGEGNTSNDKLLDPCLPKGLTKNVKVEKQSLTTEIAQLKPTETPVQRRYEEDNMNQEAEEEATKGKVIVSKYEVDRTVEGTGSYDECMNVIFPLLAEDSSECSAESSQDVSSCLLSDSMPSFDFKVNHFYGVSGYWDAMSRMLGLSDNKYGTAYSYEAFSTETAKICNMDWKDIDALNEKKSSSIFNDLSDEELSQICFKSAWVLTVLNKGLGFPLTTSSESELNSDSFKVSDKINGSEFTWTLGRAVLYASDESSREYYDYVNNYKEGIYPKVGYYHATSPGLFIRGSEAEGIPNRPLFEVRDSSKPYGNQEDPSDDEHSDDEGDDDDDNDEISKFPPPGASNDSPPYSSGGHSSIDPHEDPSNGYAISHKLLFTFTLLFVFVFMVVFMLGGKSRILSLFSEVYLFAKSLFVKLRSMVGLGGSANSKIHWPLTSRKRYKRLRSLEVPNFDRDTESGFSIDDDDDDLTDAQLAELGIDVGLGHDGPKINQSNFSSTRSSSSAAMQSIDPLDDIEMNNFANDTDGNERDDEDEDEDDDDEDEDEDDDEDIDSYQSDDIENYNYDDDNEDHEENEENNETKENGGL